MRCEYYLDGLPFEVDLHNQKKANIDGNIFEKQNIFRNFTQKRTVNKIKDLKRYSKINPHFKSLQQKFYNDKCSSIIRSKVIASFWVKKLPQSLIATE